MLVKKQSESTIYFAQQPDADITGYLNEKVQQYYSFLEQFAYAAKVCKSLAYYAGGTMDDGHISWKLSRGGEIGEVIMNFENHYRSLAQSMLTLTTSQRPAVEVIAKNSDKASLSRALVAKGIIDYYLTERGLEALLKRCVESAIVQAEGYIHVNWNRDMGSQMGSIGADGTPSAVTAGDVQFRHFEFFDVIRDPYSPTYRDLKWKILRTWVNKFDLAAQYPELKDKILNNATDDAIERRIVFDQRNKETDLICVFEFYHEKTPAVPDGRYVIWCGDEWLEGGPLPTEKIQLFRCAPSELLGTPFGYSPMFDLLGAQETVNGLDTSITTNQLGRGIGNMLVPATANISIDQLSTSMNVISFDGQQKPEALEFPPTPQEVFQYKKDKIAAMETISGINSVVRGNPSENVGADASGSKLALLQVQAIQQNGGLEREYVQLVRDVSLGLVTTYRDFGGSIPRLIKIVGKHNQYLIKDFVPDKDLSNMDQFSVDIGNPITRQISGRMALADRLSELGLIKPENIGAYIQLVKEGTLDPMVEGEQAQLLRITEENEGLLDGSVQHRAILTDPHWVEIPKHLEILDNPDLRGNDPESQQVQQAVLDAVQQHINLFRTMPPELVLMRGGQNALMIWQQMQQAAMGMPPGAPPPPGPGGPQQPPPPKGQAPDMSKLTAPADEQAKQGVPGQPSQPNLPKDPTTGGQLTVPGVTNK